MAKPRQLKRQRAGDICKPARLCIGGDFGGEKQNVQRIIHRHSPFTARQNLGSFYHTGRFESTRPFGMETF